MEEAEDQKVVEVGHHLPDQGTRVDQGILRKFEDGGDPRSRDRHCYLMRFREGPDETTGIQI